MSGGYRWRGWTPRHEQLRRELNAEWEHDQRSEAQRRRYQPQDRHARVLAYEVQKLDQEERTS